VQYPAALNVNDARKALKGKACPGIGWLGVAAWLLQAEKFRKIGGYSSKLTMVKM